MSISKGSATYFVCVRVFVLGSRHNLLQPNRRVNTMKLFKSSKVAAPRSVLGSIALAAAFFLPSGVAQASVPTVDAAVAAIQAAFHVLEDGVKWAKDFTHYAQIKENIDQAKAAKDKVEGINSELNAKIEEAKKKAYGDLYVVPDDEVVDIKRIELLLNKQSTTLEPFAQGYFGGQNVCSIERGIEDYSAEAVAIAKAALLGAKTQDHPPVARLEFNCVAQRNLAALAIQEDRNHALKMESLQKTHNVATILSQKNVGDDVQQHLRQLATFEGAQSSEKFRHEAIVKVLNVYQDMLKRTQRDIEVVMHQGIQGKGIISKAIATAAIGKVLGGGNLVAVNGNRQVSDASKMYNKGYAP